MIFPSFAGDFEIGPPIRVLEFDVRLDLNAIKILVKAVEEKCEQLLSVVLLETGELRSVFACGIRKGEDVHIENGKSR